MATRIPSVFRISLALALSVAAMPRSVAAPCLHYGSPDVTLTGMLSGLPLKGGTGTCKKEVLCNWIVDTKMDFCIDASDVDLAVGPARQFEIIPIRGLFKLRSKMVRVRGQFAGSYFPHYHSHPIVEARKVEAVQDELR